MLRRPVMYALLAVFAGAMVLLLMLEDPSAIDNLNAAASVLFPQLSRAEHIERIEVRNVTQGTGVLLVRDGEGMWYAAQMPQFDDGLPADAIDQAAVEALALSITRLAAVDRFDATPDNLARFGVRPQPEYELQFAGRDITGRAFESVVFEVGDRNPDQVARYVWPRDSEQVFLVEVDFLLEQLSGTAPSAVNSADETPTATVSAPVP
jgi:hypothetical protein